MNNTEWSVRLKKRDGILFFGIVLLLIGSAVWTFRYYSGTENGAAVRVSVEGKPDTVYRLEEDRTVRIRGEHGENVLCIRNGKAYVSEADCPDQYCVKHAPIQKDRETIVCLPNKLVVTVEGGDAWELDDVAN